MSRTSAPPPLPSSSPNHIASAAVAVKAVLLTAAGCLVVSGILFFICRKLFGDSRPCKFKDGRSFDQKDETDLKEKKRLGGLKVWFVKDKHVDVLCKTKPEDGAETKTEFSRSVCNSSYGDDQVEEKRVDTIFTRQDKSSRHEDTAESIGISLEKEDHHVIEVRILSDSDMQISPSQVPPPPPLPPRIIVDNEIGATLLPPPPPPLPLPPGQASHMSRNAVAPPPMPPPPKPKTFSLRPPPPPKGKANNSEKKLKPLHWDKVAANAEHSTVWDQIDVDGSLRFDDELMVSLFGYSASTPKPSERIASKSNFSPRSQIFILDPRRSQNMAIVVKSLAVSRQELLDAVLDGHGLSTGALEKLTKMAPTQEELAKIIQFDGDPTKLADGESFLCYILKAVPTAFSRFKAMLFRSNYDGEMLQIKETLQTLELGCKELRNAGLFLKLLEAILKAGNRLNAGTHRGNAQGFNLTALTKLNDIKGSDGKTTLLHFVVEQAARSEGRRHVVNQIHNGVNSNDTDTSPDDQDSEYLINGLQVLGGLKVELSAVRKAANIEYGSLNNIISNLSACVKEIHQIAACCGENETDTFVKEMKVFLVKCEEELTVVDEEHTRVIELVKRTTEYYQVGIIKDNMTGPIQLFTVVKDFVGMVDQVCLQLSTKLQKKNEAIDSTNSRAPYTCLSPSSKLPLRFPNVEKQLMSYMSFDD